MCRKQPGVLHRGCLEEDKHRVKGIIEMFRKQRYTLTVSMLHPDIHGQTDRDSYLLPWLGLGSVRLTLGFGMVAFGVLLGGGVSPRDLGKGFLNPFSVGSEAGRSFLCSIGDKK